MAERDVNTFTKKVRMFLSKKLVQASYCSSHRSKLFQLTFVFPVHVFFLFHKNDFPISIFCDKNMCTNKCNSVY